MVKQHLAAYLCIELGWLSAQGKTTLIAIMCVLGVLSGQGKTTLTVYICCVRCAFRSR